MPETLWPLFATYWREMLWAILVLIGWQAREARPQVFVMVLAWAVQYALLWNPASTPEGVEAQELGAVLVDGVALTFVTLLIVPRWPLWSTLPSGIFLVSLLFQGAHFGFGGNVPWLVDFFYEIATGLFTAQLLCFAVPGAHDLVCRPALRPLSRALGLRRRAARRMPFARAHARHSGRRAG